VLNGIKRTVGTLKETRARPSSTFFRDKSRAADSYLVTKWPLHALHLHRWILWQQRRCNEAVS